MSAVICGGGCGVTFATVAAVFCRGDFGSTFATVVFADSFAFWRAPASDPAVRISSTVTVFSDDDCDATFAAIVTVFGGGGGATFSTVVTVFCGGGCAGTFAATATTPPLNS